MTAYYNEHDPFAAAWLRELIADGHIAPGEVDERSIEDVTPDELAGFVQCHFFAGIGVWSLALREAGWPDHEPIWTGSCPCQPFSAAGKGGGFDDERHLWPALHWLIEQSAPAIVLGEQVASQDGLAWLNLVSADLEATGYAFGAVDTCAAGFGAPHIRQRLYWMADAMRGGAGHASGQGLGAQAEVDGSYGYLPRERQRLGIKGATVSMADAGSERRDRQSVRLLARQQGQAGLEVAGDSGAGGMGNAYRRNLRGQSGTGAGAEEGLGVRAERDGPIAPGQNDRPGPLNGLWRDADWLCCTDGKWRPVAPGTFPLAPAGTVRNRVGTLRGAGNAINLAQAQGFIEAVIDIRARSNRQEAA